MSADWGVCGLIEFVHASGPQLKQLSAGTAFDDLRQTSNVSTWQILL